MSNKTSTVQNTKKAGGLNAGIVILLALVLCEAIYYLVLGNGSNFEGGNNANHPIPGNYLGIVYKGGVIVPILMTCLLTVIIFCIERFLTINKAKGNGNVNEFLRRVKYNLETNNLDTALSDCDKQKGSVANVVKAGLVKYKEMAGNKELDTDQKVLAIRKEIEEATSLELPMLEKNLVILATLASVSTLIGLLGTVVGMIKAFAALGQAGGAVDASALSNGISEALINTALGIGSSALSIVMYNVFTTRIDGMTYAIDEAGFSIAESFAAKYK